MAVQIKIQPAVPNRVVWKCEIVENNVFWMNFGSTHKNRIVLEKEEEKENALILRNRNSD